MENTVNVTAYLVKLNNSGDFYQFAAEKGRKYIKIVSTTNRGIGRSAHAFVDAQGNVYKAASWAAPAKHARFNLADLDKITVDPYGSYLYMR
jgi:hypothetical protein